MRQGQQNNNNNNNNNKRMRGRNRKGPNPLTRSFESNGPDVKIRGTALHIAEKYVQLARDAHSSGDRVAAESYLQHAEHYYRIVAAAQAQSPQPQPIYRNDDEGDDEFDERTGFGMDRFGSQRDNDQGFSSDAPQPYVNGNGQPHGGFNGNPRPEQQSAPQPPAPQPPAAFAPEGEAGEEEAQGEGAPGEQPQYRLRRRRQNRGRFRRDGEPGTQAQGAGGQPAQGPQPVADREPSFSED